jgi:sulfatase maturation enzyme AslB (radical SAM superfamily)
LEYIRSREVYEIKQGIATGNLTPACQKCSDADAAGYYSVSRSHVEMAGRLGLPQIMDPAVPTVPREIEIRFSNLCNFKCRMCGPAWSSMIASENAEQPHLARWYPAGPAGRLDATPRFIEDAKIILKDLRRIYITGGEPMIQKPVMEFIDYMIEHGYNKHIVLQITTNVSAINPLILDRLQRFQEIHLTLSIDAIGKVAEYQRHGTIWDKIDANIHALGEFRMANPDRVGLGIHSALSAYTVLDADRLMEYCLDVLYRYHMGSWNVAQVQLPMTPNVLSGPLRQRAIDSVKRGLEILEASPVRQNKMEIYQALRSEFGNLLQELKNNPPSDQEWFRFCGLTRDLDATRNEDFGRVFGMSLG